MLEILQFMFGGFWISIASLLVIYWFLFFITNGLVRIVRFIALCFEIKRLKDNKGKEECKK